MRATRISEEQLEEKAKSFVAEDGDPIRAYKSAWRVCEESFGVVFFDDNVDNVKVCSRCHNTYNTGNFYRRSCYSDGYDCYCKFCRKELNILYREKKEREEKYARKGLHRH